MGVQEYLLQAPDPGRIDRLRRLSESIAPLARMVNSPGLDRAFGILGEHYPDMILHEYAAGSSAEDWTVPRGWALVSASMRDSAGSVVASSEECPLFVAPYSEPVDGWFSKEEIARHLRTRPDRPEAFALEHRNAYDYRLKDWGITLPHSRWTALPEGQYHVQIRTQWLESSMKVGEWVLPGDSGKTIMLTAHIDELCNDDLSGCLVGLETVLAAGCQGPRRHTVRLVLAPEMFGTIFYGHHNRHVLASAVGMLNLEALGAGESLCAKSSLSGDTVVDEALCAALDSLGLDYRRLGFFEGYGNDERVLEWPPIGIPSAALQRYPFAEYHTSDDVPALLDLSAMDAAVQACLRFLTIMEQNQTPAYSLSFQPWLTRRGLYFDYTVHPDLYHKLNNLVLFHVDGQRSVLDLARLSGLPFSTVREYLDQFVRQGVMRYDHASPGA